MTYELPDNVRELLASRIDSFEKLELVLALHAAPRSSMSVPDLAGTLKLEPTTVRQAALELRERALVEVSADEVQLLPPTTRDADAITALAHHYAQDRLAIVKALGEIGVDRIRTMASRAFVDALAARKKPPEE